MPDIVYGHRGADVEHDRPRPGDAEPVRYRASMPADDAPASRPAVAARLRAAGCVYAEDEADLLIAAADTPAELAALVGRRAAGQPLEHVLGWAEFRGLRISVDPGVFVPRRRTEFLAGQADRAGPAGGRGRGPVLRLRAPWAPRWPAPWTGAQVHAADIDPAAVRCARRNLAAAGGRVYQGDLYGPLPAALRGRVDILLANVPYVPEGEVGAAPAGSARLRGPGGPGRRARRPGRAAAGHRGRAARGWRRAAICCPRSASARWPRPPRRPPAPGWPPGWTGRPSTAPRSWSPQAASPAWPGTPHRPGAAGPGAG